MKTYCLSIFWGLLILVQTAIAESSIPECTRFEVDAPSTGIHQLFREKFPFHLQTVGIDRSNATADTVILAEPPFTEPNAHEALLKKLPQFKLAACEIRKHPIGYDGWVKDVVLTFPKLSDDQAKELLSLLHRELFGTDYKADTFDLTRLASEKFDWSNSKKQYDLDIRLPASEIRTAFWESDELRFVEITQRDGEALSARELLAQGKHGVFVTTYPGFVVWALKQGAELPDKAEIRRFALESDLVLGAVADKDDVLVLARKRIVPTEVLPALRAEDLALLAATAKDSDELAQSFQWDNPFAGKLLRGEERGKDWVPAYLSDILVDSYFGSILNVADILIKSWSEKGAYRVDRFEKYPTPKEWPPFSKGLFKTIKDEVRVDNLRYNWNTGGAFIISGESYRVFSIARSGCLPVSYTSSMLLLGVPFEIPHRMYEEQGYSYFSTLSDSHLVQVVRYSSLFSLFRNFSIFNSEYQVQDNEHDAGEFTQEEMRKFNSYIQKSDDDVLYDRLNSADLSLVNETIASSVQEYVSRTNLTAEYSATLNTHLFKYLLWSSLKSHKGQKSFVNDVIPEGFFRKVFADIEGIKQRYSVYIQNAKPDRWIRTPSIVVSTNSILAGMQGGHNISAKIIPEKLPEESNLDGADTILQIQKSVNTALLAKLVAPKIASYLSNKTPKQLAEAGLQNFVTEEEKYTVSVNFPKDALIKLKDQPLKPIDPVEDVLIRDSQIQIRVLYSKENRKRDSDVIMFNLDSSTTASLVGIVPLCQAGEFLDAKMAILGKSLLRVKRIEGKNPVKEIYWNGQLTSAEVLKEKMKKIPAEERIFLVTHSGKYADFTNFTKSLEEILLDKNIIFVKDADVVQASANLDKQVPIQLVKVDGKQRLNIDVVIVESLLMYHQKDTFVPLKEFLVNQGITSMTLDQFFARKPEETSPTIGMFFAEKLGFNEAIAEHAHGFQDKFVLNFKCGDHCDSEETAKIELNQGASGTVNFGRELAIADAIRLLKELFSQEQETGKYKYINMMPQDALRKAIKEIGKTNPEVANKLRKSIFNQSHNDWWQYYPNQQYAWG